MRLSSIRNAPPRPQGSRHPSGSAGRPFKIGYGAAPKRRAKRLHRRPAAELDKLVAQIVDLVGKHAKDGIRAENIRTTLGIERRELPRPLSCALTGRKS
jgi:hypothetical protein